MGEFLFVLTFIIGCALVNAGGYDGGTAYTISHDSVQSGEGHFGAEAQVSHSSGGYGGASNGASVGFGVALNPVGLLGAFVPHVDVGGSHHAHDSFGGHGSSSHAFTSSSSGDSFQGTSGGFDDSSFQTAEDLNAGGYVAHGSHGGVGLEGNSGAHHHVNKAGAFGDSSFQKTEERSFHESHSSSFTGSHVNSNSADFDVQGTTHGVKLAKYQDRQNVNSVVHGSYGSGVDVLGSADVQHTTDEVNGSGVHVFENAASHGTALNLQTAQDFNSDNQGTYGAGLLGSTDSYLDSAHHGSSVVGGDGAQSVHQASTHSDSSFQSSYQSSSQTHKTQGTGHEFYGSKDTNIGSTAYGFNGVNGGTVGGHSKSNFQTAQDLNVDTYGTHSVGGVVHTHKGSSVGEFNDESSFQTAQDIGAGFQGTHNSGTGLTNVAGAHVTATDQRHSTSVGGFNNVGGGVHDDLSFQTAQKLDYETNGVHDTSAGYSSNREGQLHGVYGHGNVVEGSRGVGGVHGGSSYQSTYTKSDSQFTQRAVDVDVQGSQDTGFGGYGGNNIHNSHQTNVGAHGSHNGGFHTHGESSAHSSYDASSNGFVGGHGHEHHHHEGCGHEHHHEGHNHHDGHGQEHFHEGHGHEHHHEGHVHGVGAGLQSSHSGGLLSSGLGFGILGGVGGHGHGHGHADAEYEKSSRYVDNSGSSSFGLGFGGGYGGYKTRGY